MAEWFDFDLVAMAARQRPKISFVLIGPPELERRLLELGFVEGASVELLHQGLFGGDPIAVRVAATTIALRRREAMAVTVSASSP